MSDVQIRKILSVLLSQKIFLILNHQMRVNHRASPQFVCEAAFMMFWVLL